MRGGVVLPIGLAAGRLVSVATLAALAPSFVLSGCGITADYSGLQGGVRDSGLEPPDGANGTVDAAMTVSDGDAGGDVADTSVPPDAAADASVSFCASLPTPVQLCTDFDEGEQISATESAGWTYTDGYGGFNATVSTMESFSHPASFFSLVNPSGAPSSARLEENLPTNPASVHIEFEMLLTPSTTGTLELAVLHEVVASGPMSGTTYGVFYREIDGALQVELRALLDDGGEMDQSWPVGPAPSSWTHVAIDIDVSDSGSFTVQQGGSVVLTETDLPTLTANTQMFVELGFYTNDPASGQAYFDNAILDWH